MENIVMVQTYRYTVIRGFGLFETMANDFKTVNIPILPLRRNLADFRIGPSLRWY